MGYLHLPLRNSSLDLSQVNLSGAIVHGSYHRLPSEGGTRAAPLKLLTERNDFALLNGPQVYSPDFTPSLFGNRKLVITLDGPAASGKTSTAEKIIRNLRAISGIPEFANLILIDSGSLFRSVAYQFLQSRATPPNLIEKISHFGIALHGDKGTQIELTSAEREYFSTLTRKLPVSFAWVQDEEGKESQEVFLIDDSGTKRDVTSEIRSAEVNAIVPAIASIAEVRAAIKERQAIEAKTGGCITTGRAQGQEIFGETREIEKEFFVVRLFLDVSLEEATARRTAEKLTSQLSGQLPTELVILSSTVRHILQGKSIPEPLEDRIAHQDVQAIADKERKNLEERNQKDRNRTPHPLLTRDTLPGSVIQIDSSKLTPGELWQACVSSVGDAIAANILASSSFPLIGNEDIRIATPPELIRAQFIETFYSEIQRQGK